MNEEELRLHRCCFTGHRPEKINTPEATIIEALRGEVETAIQNGFATFITGMAQGVDIWAGEIVLELRERGKPIRLICASPFRGFELRWTLDWQLRYQAIMETADLVRFICPRYTPDCFQRRNEWMVNHSARVIAVYNGQPSGTRNTVEYAQQKGIHVSVIPIR